MAIAHVPPRERKKRPSGGGQLAACTSCAAIGAEQVREGLFSPFLVRLCSLKPLERFFERDTTGLFRPFGQKCHKLLTLTKLHHLALKLVGRFENKDRAIFGNYMHRLRCGSLKQFVDRQMLCT